MKPGKAASRVAGALVLSACLIAGKPAPGTRAEMMPQLFNSVEFKRPISLAAAWLDAMARNRRDPAFLPERRIAPGLTWGEFRQRAAAMNPTEMLRFVNAFWNRWPFRSDIENYGKEDYWASPAEFIRKSGDCEDYAIVKYFCLRELGVAAEEMRIAVLMDTRRNLPHAVLAVYRDNDILILDSLGNDVRSHSIYAHYRPQFSVNENARWMHIPLTEQGG